MTVQEELTRIRKWLDLANKHGSLERAGSEIIDGIKAASIYEFSTLMEECYQQLLKKCGGNTELLARGLFELIFSHNSQSQTAFKKQNIDTGRPPVKWGEGGIGKLVIWELVNRELERMKNNGTVKPKIIDAIKRILNINERRKDDLARMQQWQSAYSEANSMIEKEK